VGVGRTGGGEEPTGTAADALPLATRAQLVTFEAGPAAETVGLLEQAIAGGALGEQGSFAVSALVAMLIWNDELDTAARISGEVIAAAQRQGSEARMRAFVGRATELASFGELLNPGTARCVLFVHGPGGIGKTTLLQQFRMRARAAGRVPVLIDGRDVDCSPEGFQEALDRAITKQRGDAAGPGQPGDRLDRHRGARRAPAHLTGRPRSLLFHGGVPVSTFGAAWLTRLTLEVHLAASPPELLRRRPSAAVRSGDARSAVHKRQLAVRHLAEFCSTHAVNCFGDGLGVAGVAGEVHHHPVGVGLDHVHGGDGAAGLADGGGEAPDPPRVGVQLDAHGDGVGGVGRGHRGSFAAGTCSVLPGRRG
jgi:hypothetical protein